jgi:hypothetical protein
MNDYNWPKAMEIRNIIDMPILINDVYFMDIDKLIFSLFDQFHKTIDKYVLSRLNGFTINNHSFTLKLSNVMDETYSQQLSQLGKDSYTMLASMINNEYMNCIQALMSNGYKVIKQVATNIPPNTDQFDSSIYIISL